MTTKRKKKVYWAVVRKGRLTAFGNGREFQLPIFTTKWEADSYARQKATIEGGQQSSPKLKYSIAQCSIHITPITPPRKKTRL